MMSILLKVIHYTSMMLRASYVQSRLRSYRAWTKRVGMPILRNNSLESRILDSWNVLGTAQKPSNYSEQES